ncbi:hypothetical protein HK104_002806 [Borealophlyctis nickersoniae]|nr:hypothetical protein HK104_002806 [Borealophlyctis nickersoniae]
MLNPSFCQINNYDPHSAEWAMEGTGRRVAYDDFTTIDWIHDFSKERVRRRNLRNLQGPWATVRKAYDSSQGWLLVFIVGAVTGLLAAYIDVASEWLSDVKNGYCSAGFYLNRNFCCWHVDGDGECEDWVSWSSALRANNPIATWWAEYFMFVLTGTTMALASAMLVKFYAPYAAGSGIPEVKTILGGFVIRKFLGGWTLLVLFQVEYKRDWHTFELPFFMLLGALGGLYGSFFIRTNTRINAFRKFSWLKEYGPAEVCAVAFATGVVGFWFMFTRESTVELVANLFRECEEVEGDFHGLCSSPRMWSVIGLLLVAAIIKIFLTIFTFGTRIPAGIFIPSMAVGACVGRALGIAMQLWQESFPDLWLFSSCPSSGQCVTPGTYAMVGSAAALGGVTRMTVSLTVIMFELTGALSYVLPIMITVMVSKWVGDAFGKESIYDALIHLNGYPFLDNKEAYTYNTVASAVMTKFEDLDVITATGHNVDTLDELLQNTDCKGYPIIDTYQGRQLVGFAGKAEIRYAIDQARKDPTMSGTSPCYFTEDLPLFDSAFDSAPVLDLRPWIDQTPMTITPRFPMEMVIELFKKMGLRQVLITQNGKLCGLLTKKDLLRHVVDMNHPRMARRTAQADSRRRQVGDAGWRRVAG